MNKLRPFLIFSLLCLPLILSGCISREQADEKMAKGCVAGISYLVQPRQVLEVKDLEFSKETADGVGFRKTSITVLEKDGWAELDKQYSCVFQEDWSFMKMAHKAMLTRINIDGQIYGRKDGEITGSFDDFLNLTNVVEGAMSE